MNLMTLKEARQMAYENRRMPVVPHSACNGMVILDDRVAELEADVSRLATMSIKKNTENSSLILKVTELEAQRDELVRAALGVLKIAQSTYHSDDRGPGDLCSILENAIEKATGGKWWNVIKASDRED